MRFSLFLIFSVLFSISASAREQELWIWKKVSNVFTKEPVLDAKVDLLSEDSTLVATSSSNGSINGRKGAAMFILKKPGRYILHATHPDYEDAYENFEIAKFYKKERSRRLPTLYMQRKYPKQRSLDELQQLEDVVVKATKVKFYMNKDTLVYNADAFNLQEGSMLDDLIRQLPGVTMNDNGQIAVNGKPVAELLLNGKAFFNHDRKLILDNLPSFMVNHLKVYDKRTAWQELRGDSVGPKSYVMDIGLKRKYQTTWLATVEGGLGSDDRFLGRLFALRLTPHSKISAFANFNNLNDDRKPGNNSDWSPLQQPVNETTVRTAGMDYATESKEGVFMSDGNVVFTSKRMTTESRTSSEYFLTKGNTFGKSLLTGLVRDVSVGTQHSLAWKIPTITHINVKPRFSYHKFNRTSTQSSIMLLDDKLDLWGKAWMDSIASPLGSTLLKEYVINHLMVNTRGNGWDWQGGIDYGQFLMIPHRSDHALYFDGSYRYDNAEINSFDHYRLDYVKEGEQDYRNRFDKVKNSGYQVSAHLSDSWEFVHTSSRVFRLEPGYSFDFSHRNTTRNLYLLNQLTGWGVDTSHFLGELPSVQELELALDHSNSNRTCSDVQTHTPQLGVYAERKVSDSLLHVIMIKFPLGIKRSELKYASAMADTTVHHTDVLFMPSLTYSMQGTPRRGRYDLSVNYNLSVNVPSLLYWVNRTDNSNPLYIVQGAKSLRNEQVHNFSVTWRQTLPGQRIYHVGTLFAIHRNSLAMGQSYNLSTGVRTVTPTTVNGNWNTSLYSGLSLPLFRDRQVMLQWDNAVNFWHKVDLLSDSQHPTSQRSSVSSLYFEETLKLSYRPTSKFGIGLKSGAHTQHSTSRREGFENISICDFDYGATLQWQLPFKWQVSTDLTMYSRRGYNDREMNTDELVWNARLTKTFLKGRLACMLDAFDILGNLSNVRRSIDAFGRTEVWHHVTPRYAMLHIAYRFNKQPKK